MKGKSFHNILTDKFPHEPTQSQVRGFRIIADFLTRSKNNEILLIKGYAGTGKTTLIGHLVKNLNWVNKKFVLLAPTGRAAKVLSSYAGKPAFTIHRKIYFSKSDSGGAGVKFMLKENKSTNTCLLYTSPSPRD